LANPCISSSDTSSMVLYRCSFVHSMLFTPNAQKENHGILLFIFYYAAA
jgi:hypothetical protein